MDGGDNYLSVLSRFALSYYALFCIGLSLFRVSSLVNYASECWPTNGEFVWI